MGPPRRRPPQGDASQQGAIEGFADEHAREEQVEGAGAAEELAGGEAEDGAVSQAADPARGAWLGGDADLLDLAAGLTQAVEDDVERIGRRRAGGQDELGALGNGSAEGIAQRGTRWLRARGPCPASSHARSGPRRDCPSRAETRCRAVARGRHEGGAHRHEGNTSTTGPIDSTASTVSKGSSSGAHLMTPSCVPGVRRQV